MFLRNCKKRNKTQIENKKIFNSLFPFQNLFYLCVASTKAFMVIVAQLVRAPVCGSGGRGFESRLSPKIKSSMNPLIRAAFFI